MKITIAQLNPIVGDVDGNAKRIIETIDRHAPVSDLIVFPELAITGYPPRDLLERRWFIDRTEEGIAKVAAATASCPGCGVLFGAPVKSGARAGKGLHNSALLAQGGTIVFIQAKTLLPTYDVFDEQRYFDPAASRDVFRFGEETLGVSICEDAWSGVTAIPHGHAYPTDPVSELAKKGATIFINLSASPFEVGKLSARMDLVGAHAKKHGIPFAYCDQVGGNDELVFDGTSFFMDASGRPIGVLPSFAESVAVFDSGARGAASPAPEPDAASSICNALVLGVRDYLRKTGFSKAVVGLSGGIDSAVVCAIAAEALGSENVMGISMPSPYSSGGSIEDSRLLAKNLGVKFLVIPITEVFKAYLDVLEPQFTGMRPDTTEENIQARIRGNYLMAFSNKYGSIVLSTGNKSELAVGYCTLYGDMSGGLAVIADVPKTMVYGVAAHINRDREIIPVATIRKAPSAELKPDQKDQDTLPPYEILDAILERYLEDGLSVRELEAEGFDPKTVAWVVGTVNRNEYKRRQAAPGLKVTSKAFGVGRRIPIAARYRP